jgi:phage replication-related protein YjqB (UPF0714/DUF867 family)
MPSGSDTARPRVGKYASFAELARHEVHGEDYRVQVRLRSSPVLILAPHGGLIEDGTSELAHEIAGAEHSLFSFEGLKPDRLNRELHITSHLFDHPDCLELLGRSEVVLSVHGCRGDSCIHLGGLDRAFVTVLARELVAAGFPVEAASRRYPGLHPRNICNRGTRGAGAQLEVTFDLRREPFVHPIGRAVRSAIEAHLALTATTLVAGTLTAGNLTVPAGRTR